jgi:hypothetical protein
MATHGTLNRSRTPLTDDGIFWVPDHPCAVVHADPHLLAAMDVFENVVHEQLTLVEGLRW